MSMTSARMCTDDQDGTEPMSASASMIASGGASMTISRDARTATIPNVAPRPDAEGRSAITSRFCPTVWCPPAAPRRLRRRCGAGTGPLPFVERGDDAQRHEHRPAAEVGDQVQRRHRRPVAVAERRQRPGLRQLVDVMAGRGGPRAVLTPSGDPREDQPRIDRRALVGTDAAEFDDPHPGQRAGHLPFFTLSTRLRNPSVEVSITPLMVRLSRKPGSGTIGSIVMSNFTRVLSPSGINVYVASCARCWPALTSVQLTVLSPHV